MLAEWRMNTSLAVSDLCTWALAIVFLSPIVRPGAPLLLHESSADGQVCWPVDQLRLSCTAIKNTTTVYMQKNALIFRKKGFHRHPQFIHGSKCLSKEINIIKMAYHITVLVASFHLPITLLLPNEMCHITLHFL